jgi:bifunctional DNase/RNase
MDNVALEVTIRGVMPTHSGSAVFLGNDSKTFVIYVDQGIGTMISMALDGTKRERPLTHDLIGMILKGFGAKLDRMIINDVDEGTFFARLLFKMENELGRKILELDARPSDSMVLAIQEGVPLMVARDVFEKVEDMTAILERIMNQDQEE